jgi:hypothetical protein
MPIDGGLVLLCIKMAQEGSFVEDLQELIIRRPREPEDLQDRDAHKKIKPI